MVWDGVCIISILNLVNLSLRCLLCMFVSREIGLWYPLFLLFTDLSLYPLTHITNLSITT